MATSPEATKAPPSRSQIVVGVDGSESSLEALRWARELAKRSDAGIEVIAAWQWPAGWAAGWTGGWSPQTDAQTSADDAVLTVFGERQPDRVTINVEQGTPAACLVEASKTAIMIILGSRGHGGFAGLLLGSVSSAVAEHSDCPVLVVHGNTLGDFAMT